MPSGLLLPAEHLFSLRSRDFRAHICWLIAEGEPNRTSKPSFHWYVLTLTWQCQRWRTMRFCTVATFTLSSGHGTQATPELLQIIWCFLSSLCEYVPSKRLVIFAPVFQNAHFLTGSFLNEFDFLADDVSRDWAVQGVQKVQRGKTSGLYVWIMYKIISRRFEQQLQQAYGRFFGCMPVCWVPVCRFFFFFFGLPIYLLFQLTSLPSASLPTVPLCRECHIAMYAWGSVWVCACLCVCMWYYYSTNSTIVMVFNTNELSL